MNSMSAGTYNHIIHTAVLHSPLSVIVEDFSPSAVPPNCEFVVNFSRDLSVIIREACCMEKLGFMVPDLARNVALQEEKFLDYCSSLEHCLARYHSALASLNDAEVYTTVC